MFVVCPVSQDFAEACFSGLAVTSILVGVWTSSFVDAQEVETAMYSGGLFLLR